MSDTTTVDASVAELIRALQRSSATGRYPTRLLHGRGEVGACQRCGASGAIELRRVEAECSVTTRCPCSPEAVLARLAREWGFVSDGN